MTPTTNLDRTNRARSTLDTYRLLAAQGGDLDDALNDLLTDLMHWCQFADRDFERALYHARMRFDAEVQP